MRVVIDTNVMGSGVLNPHASPERILDAILSGTITGCAMTAFSPSTAKFYCGQHLVFGGRMWACYLILWKRRANP